MNITIRPQEGAQEQFLSTNADIVIYGGSAGGGKTFSLLVEPIYHIKNSKFAALILRKNSKDVRNTGGLWDSSFEMYTHLNATPLQQPMKWTFPSGATVQFAHLEHDKTVYSYQGTQIPLLCFDELTHFSKFQFFYMLSRNRSLCGIKPYVRATTNPDRDSWVRQFISWWIDEKSGYAIQERSGVIRYFVRVNDDFIYGDSIAELAEYCQPTQFERDMFKDLSEEELRELKKPKSLTFIRASLADNKILVKNNPAYYANLASQNAVEKARLMDGNWNISYSDLGSVLNRSDFKRYDPTQYRNYEKVYFVVDSASKVKDANDYSVVGLFGRLKGEFFIIDWLRQKLEAPELEQSIIDLWYKHQALRPQAIYIERGSSGTSLVQHIQRKKIPVFEIEPIKDKFLRLNDVLGIIKSNFVYIPDKCSWANDFFTECEYFRADMKHVIMNKETKPHDDQVDVLAYGLSSSVNPSQLKVFVKDIARPKRYDYFAHN